MANVFSTGLCCHCHMSECSCGFDPGAQEPANPELLGRAHPGHFPKSKLFTGCDRLGDAFDPDQADLPWKWWEPWKAAPHGRI